MPRGKRFSDEERRLVQVLSEEGMTCRDIARRLKRSFSSVSKIIRLGDAYGRGRSSGRTSSLTKRDKMHILRVASKSCSTAKAITEKVGVAVSVRTVQIFL